MQFIWDEDKNVTNVAKHGLNFKDARRVFQSDMDILIDDRDDYDEVRWIGTGLLDDRVVVVVYTEPNEDTIRIISLRKALPYERKKYEQNG